MKIYINGRFLTQPITGVERYAYRICTALHSIGISFTVICPEGSILPCYDVRQWNIIHYGRGRSHIWEQFVLPFFFIGKKDYIIFSFTGLGSIFIKNKVMTIHDLSFLENPSWFSRAYYWWYKILTPLAVKTSKKLITVSEFSKREILRFYPFLKADNIRVIYGAIDNETFHQKTQASTGKELFALAVSSLDPRKNFNNLIEAFKHIKGCQLKIVGSRNRVFTDDCQSNLSTAHIEYIGRVSDEKLTTLYNQASLFIFPSVYEGFGLPPLEAMACGCTVLVSDIPVLREVCGDAALYFDPYNVNDIIRAIAQYLSESDVIKETMHKKGLANISRFSWEKSALALMNIVEDVQKQKDCE